MNIRHRLFHLSHVSAMSNRTLIQLLSIDPQLTNFFKTPQKYSQLLYPHNKQKQERFLEEFYSIQTKKLLSMYESQGIAFITIYDKKYPMYLRQIHNPPTGLFLKGDLTLLGKPSLAIVGSRNSTKYSYDAVRILLPELIFNKIAIVSGLAKGADTIAHQLAIKMGGKTIAVIGGGFFHIYPKENSLLADVIGKEHLLVSEFPPIRRPEKWHFPMRNRIIAGLSLGTFVLQARRKSGSLITADYALEEGREVFALPGPVNDPLSEGTNHLIQQGAKLVISANDIMNELYIDDHC